MRNGCRADVKHSGEEVAEGWMRYWKQHPEDGTWNEERLQSRRETFRERCSGRLDAVLE